MSSIKKFRAWGENIKEYMSQSFDGEVEIANVTRILGDLIDQGNWVIEQNTGLKDKNGKEIYEGDIVKARWRRAKHAKLDTKGEIKFSDGWFYIDDDPDGQDRLGVPIHNCYNVEVIGNIHENPELLGEKQ